ncbi:hyoscyamine 6-dioxygenase-like isoform X2 [Diospyros lotus]|uniref:hyoscyamine 6-dioxygenase-like isoform X2 n=1 Tax=Diospyros lotus TaxID=55363 RepID=UPI00225680A6|nr:hyoscyamine 6-dioxygenase-like isoform X2 [Diospyros lotus]
MLSEALMDDTLSVFKEFFSLPAKYKASFFSNDPDKACRLYSSTLNYDKEEHHYWRDNFTHRCHPLEDYIHLWPQKPTRYREVVGRYSVEVRKLLMRILGLISEGLGIEDGYFEGELSKTQLISVNHHIPCPDPSLTLGMPEHCDPNLITALHQCDVLGLQVLKDGQWLGVEPLPHAFLVIPGLQLRVISNERLTSPKHRVVTHKEKARTTIGTFLIPSHEVLIEPAKALVKGSSHSTGPPVYRAFTYRDFFGAFTGKSCDAESALGCFKL